MITLNSLRKKNNVAESRSNSFQKWFIDFLQVKSWNCPEFFSFHLCVAKIPRHRSCN